METRHEDFPPIFLPTIFLPYFAECWREGKNMVGKNIQIYRDTFQRKSLISDVLLLSGQTLARLPPTYVVADRASSSVDANRHSIRINTANPPRMIAAPSH